jgi:hypothetical protein
MNGYVKVGVKTRALLDFYVPQADPTCTQVTPTHQHSLLQLC